MLMMMMEIVMVMMMMMTMVMMMMMAMMMYVAMHTAAPCHRSRVNSQMSAATLGGNPHFLRDLYKHCSAGGPALTQVGALVLPGHSGPERPPVRPDAHQ